jgi:hypothetical protein
MCFFLKTKETRRRDVHFSGAHRAKTLVDLLNSTALGFENLELSQGTMVGWNGFVCVLVCWFYAFAHQIRVGLSEVGFAFAVATVGGGATGRQWDSGQSGKWEGNLLSLKSIKKFFFAYVLKMIPIVLVMVGWIWAKNMCFPNTF